jgi:hypothetical protein
LRIQFKLRNTGNGWSANRRLFSSWSQNHFALVPRSLESMNAGDPHCRSKVWKTADREIGKPGENRGKVIAHRQGGVQIPESILSSHALSVPANAVLQGRDRGIGSSQPKTRADADNSACFGGKRWDAYRRRNMRTHSSTSREVLSALRMTHVWKHNDGSERGFTTTPSAYEEPGPQGAWNGCRPVSQ